MRLRRLSRALLILLALSLGNCTNAPNPEAAKEAAASEPTGTENIAYQWGAMALQATANDTERFKPRPTVTSRYLGLIFVAVFDAWSRYDEKAKPVYLKGVARQPAAAHTLANKEEAISYAAYRAMCEYYYTDSLLFKDFMRDLGYDPDNDAMDPSSPAGIGNLAAAAVIQARKGDGANQYGEAEGANGLVYADYTGYMPVNTPDENVDINRWQPKYFVTEDGHRYAPGCLTPYWQHVEPIGIKSADQFRPGPPPMQGSEQLAREVEEVVALQANLTDEEKALVEFMRDGPQSVQQAGHWLKFAQDVSRRDAHTLDQDVKMYFFNQVTAMDAFIASWDSKMYYDFARPYALVHDHYRGKEITGWAGPGKGMVKMKGEEWRPYSPSAFLCPPFPSYVSGHSTVSGACAEALKLFTGSDHFGEQQEWVAGALTELDNLGDTVVLEFPTFTETAEMAGISRVLGGYHIQSENIAGLELGRDVAREVWGFYQAHIGTAQISSAE